MAFNDTSAMENITINEYVNLRDYNSYEYSKLDW